MLKWLKKHIRQIRYRRLFKNVFNFPRRMLDFKQIHLSNLFIDDVWRSIYFNGRMRDVAEIHGEAFLNKYQYDYIWKHNIMFFQDDDCTYY